MRLEVKEVGMDTDIWESQAYRWEWVQSPSRENEERRGESAEWVSGISVLRGWIEWE